MRSARIPQRLRDAVGCRLCKLARYHGHNPERTIALTNLLCKHRAGTGPETNPVRSLGSMND